MYCDHQGEGSYEKQLFLDVTRCQKQLGLTKTVIHDVYETSKMDFYQSHLIWLRMDGPQTNQSG